MCSANIDTYMTDVSFFDVGFDEMLLRISTRSNSLVRNASLEEPIHLIVQIYRLLILDVSPV